MRLRLGLESRGAKYDRGFIGTDGPASGVIRREEEERVLSFVVPRGRVKTRKGQGRIPDQVFLGVQLNESAGIGYL